MKKLKNIFKILLMIININLVVALIVSFNFPDVLVSNITKETIKNYKEPNIIINSDPTDTSDIVTTDDEEINKILQSEEVQGLVKDYINKTLSSIDDPSELENIDFESDAIEYIKDNKEKIENATGIEITDETLKKARQTLHQKEINNVVKQNIRNTSNNMTKGDKKVIRGYIKFISPTCRIILMCIMLVNLFLLFIINRSLTKLLNYIGITLLVGGIETIILSICVDIIISSRTNLTDFNASLLLKPSIIISMTGLLLIIVYYLKRKGKKYE